MSYHGFEIYFLYLGNADSIFLRHYNQGVQTNILIDGGRSKHTAVVREFLKARRETKIAHLICSHHHEDHAAGLVGLVNDTSLQIDKAWVHTGDLIEDRIDKSRFQAFGSLLKQSQATKAIQNDLIAALNHRRIPIEEPFAFKAIGPLHVVSPTVEFYNAQLELIKQESVAEALNKKYSWKESLAMMHTLFGTKYDELFEAKDDDALGGEPTSPENEVSTILWLSWPTVNNTEDHYLLTADAGTAALTALKQRSTQVDDAFAQLRWMQIPHHGSRRNLNADLISYFRPKLAYVSAEGSKKHPSVKLINTLKEGGTVVYSTHYPPDKEEGSWLRLPVGNVPPVATSPAVSLWNAD